MNNDTNKMNNDTNIMNNYTNIMNNDTNIMNNDTNIINSYKSDDYYLEYYNQNQNDVNKKIKKNNFEKLICSSLSDDNENSLEDSDDNSEKNDNNYLDINEFKKNYKINQKNNELLPLGFNKDNNENQKKSQLFHNNYNVKKTFCTNCGKYGHNYKKCIYPIISVGIICVLFTPVYFNDMIYYIKKFQHS